MTLTLDLQPFQEQIIKAIPSRFDEPDLDVGGGKHFRYTFDVATPYATIYGGHRTHVGIPGQTDDENPKVTLSDGPNRGEGDLSRGY